MIEGETVLADRFFGDFRVALVSNPGALETLRESKGYVLIEWEDKETGKGTSRRYSNQDILYDLFVAILEDTANNVSLGG